MQPNDQTSLNAATPTWIAPAPGAKTKNIVTSTNTLVKTGSGVFTGLTVNTGQASATATVYDGTDATGTKLGTFSLATQTALGLPGGGWKFATGLFVVTAGATPADVTVSYI